MIDPKVFKTPSKFFGYKKGSMKLLEGVLEASGFTSREAKKDPVYGPS